MAKKNEKEDNLIEELQKEKHNHWEVAGSLIFMIIAVILMMVAARYLGN